MAEFEAYMEQEFEHLYRAHQKLLAEGAPSLTESEGESAWAYALMEQAFGKGYCTGYREARRPARSPILKGLQNARHHNVPK